MREMNLLSKRALIVLASMGLLTFAGCDARKGNQQAVAPAAAPVAAAPAAPDAAAAPAAPAAAAPAVAAPSIIGDIAAAADAVVAGAADAADTVVDAAAEAAGAAAETIVDAAEAAAAVVAPLDPSAAIDLATLTPALLNIDALPVKGNPNAKVTIVEFSDYECPFCSRVEPTVKQILDAYPNDVRVAFINAPLPFHQNALPAAKAAVAAMKLGGKDAYWKMHDKLFANQKALTMDNFKAFAAEIGIDAAAFEVAMNSSEVANYVAQGQKAAQDAGVNGTPSFSINGVQFVGAQPFDNFKRAIDAEIERANGLATQCNIAGDALYKQAVKKAPKPQSEMRAYIDIENAPVLGDANAPVTIIEFTDFQCPFCSRANNTIHELLDKNPGKAKLVFRSYPLPFHDKAQLAHQAAEAAKAQGKFWEYYDLLFANQQKLDRDSLIAFAKQIGLNEVKFIADMDSAAAATAVKNDLELGSKAGVNGTPHFLINGRVLSGAQPLDAFQSALNAELETANKLIAAGTPAAQVYKAVVDAENAGDNANPCE